MANYSEEDKKAFRLKDQLNSRMSALKCAGTNNEGNSISAEDMLTEADKYYAWLYPNGTPSEEVKSNVLPTPTAIQKKVLDAIFSELGTNDSDQQAVQVAVLKWAKEVHGIAKYPESTKSADVFVEWNNKQNV